jgi:hypothetical protein
LPKTALCHFRLTPTVSEVWSDYQNRSSTYIQPPEVINSDTWTPFLALEPRGHNLTPGQSRASHLPTVLKSRGHSVTPRYRHWKPVQTYSGHLPSFSRLRGHTLTPEPGSLKLAHSLGHLPALLGPEPSVSSGLGCQTIVQDNLLPLSNPRVHTVTPGHPRSSHSCTCWDLSKLVTTLSLTKLAQTLTRAKPSLS